MIDPLTVFTVFFWYFCVPCAFVMWSIKATYILIVGHLLQQNTSSTSLTNRKKYCLIEC